MNTNRDRAHYRTERLAYNIGGTVDSELPTAEKAYEPLLKYYSELSGMGRGEMSDADIFKYYGIDPKNIPAELRTPSKTWLSD
jgi:hypothetical protein